MTSFGAAALGLGAPAGYAALHGALNRVTPIKHWPRQKSAALVCALGAAIEIGVWLFSLELSIQALCFACLVSLATGHVYFHIFNMSETARRIRLLIARYRGLRNISELGSEPKARLRLQRLVDLGEIKRVGDRYLIQPGLLTLAARALVVYERCLFPDRFTPRRE
jgi:hypothetical protein